MAQPKCMASKWQKQKNKQTNEQNIVIKSVIYKYLLLQLATTQRKKRVEKKTEETTIITSKFPNCLFKKI